MKRATIDIHLLVTVLFSIAASLLFIPLFIYRGIGFIDFWWWMSIALILLISTGILIDHDYFASLAMDVKRDITRKIITGLGAAFMLFAVFFIGNIVSRHIFTFAGGNIDAIYGFKGGATPLRIMILMALIIGPGEELFWRGFLQKRFSRDCGVWTGYVLATAIYTVVHTASGNIMLVLAALVCGIFWGFLYFRYGSMVINIVSHTVWDIAVFLIFPFTG
jgi:uncharacterized protein